MIPIRHGQDVGLAQTAVVGDIKVPTESRLAAAAAVGVLLGVLLIEAFAQIRPLPAQLNVVPIDAPKTIAPAVTADAIPPPSVIPAPVNIQVLGPTVAPVAIPTAVSVPTAAPTSAAPTATSNPLPVLPPPTAAPPAAPALPIVVPPRPSISLPPVPPLH